MRRSEIKRKTPPKSGDSTLKRTWLKPRSKKREHQMKTVRIPMVKAHEGGCEVCPILDALGIETHCAGVISGMHERRKSSSGGSRENPAGLYGACSWGNGFIEDAVGEDREKIEASSLVVREGHPEYESLGVRAWRDRP